MASMLGSAINFARVDVQDEGTEAVFRMAGITTMPTFVFAQGGHYRGEVRGSNIAAVERRLLDAM